MPRQRFDKSVIHTQSVQLLCRSAFVQVGVKLLLLLVCPILGGCRWLIAHARPTISAVRKLPHTYPTRRDTCVGACQPLPLGVKAVQGSCSDEGDTSAKCKPAADTEALVTGLWQRRNRGVCYIAEVECAIH